MDLFDLAARITLDTSEYERGIENAAGKAHSFSGKIKNALATVGKVSLSVVGASAAGIAAIVKQSASAYAEYEQLVGGVETLFGDSAKQVMADAQQAFKTAGMTANQYMETSIQSAAALINSLGGDQAKAAELMSLSITDMADNANKMGTSMEAIQDAYRGFSRGNFTMLDNLALGFAGTKEGMQELLDKAQELSGIEYDISSYSDIVEAIHVVQTEMGITGTTAKEAAATIQGSLSATKSAWQNLVAGLADSNADISMLVDDFISSASTLVGNIVPVITQALSGIGNAVTKLAPALMDGFANLIVDVLPGLIESALTLVAAFADALIDNTGAIIDAGFEILNLFVNYLQDPSGLLKLLDAALVIIGTLADNLVQSLPTLIPAIIEIMLTIAEKLMAPDTLLMLVDAAIEILLALADGIINSLDIIISKAPIIVKSLVSAIIQAAPRMLDAAFKLLGKLGEGIRQGLTALVTIGKSIVEGIWRGISSGLGWIKGKISGWVGNVMSFIKGLFGIHSPSKWAETVIGKNLALGMAVGITSNADEVEDALSGLADGVKSTADITLNRGNIVSGVHTDGGDSIGDTLRIIRQYLPIIADKQIYLDTGVLAGAMVDPIDKKLGNRAQLFARGIA